jgi:hypothetical protein
MLRSARISPCEKHTGKCGREGPAALVGVIARVARYYFALW